MGDPCFTPPAGTTQFAEPAITFAERRPELEELIAAALTYGAAQEKYAAEYERRPPQSIPHANGTTEVLFDNAQRVAVHAVHDARRRMETLAEQLYKLSKEQIASVFP